MLFITTCTYKNYIGAFLIAISCLAVTAMADNLQENQSVSANRQLELENLLEQDCGSCHGSLLTGGLGPSLIPEALEGKSAELLKITILDGRPNTAMPPWRPLLSKTDVDWLVARLLNPALKNKQKEKNEEEKE